MRDEIRLGNEALAQNDMETAKQHVQHLLDQGGTPLQEQIVGNRLREIQAKASGALRSATGETTQTSFHAWWHTTPRHRTRT